jgi:hypothetical protein
VVSRKVIAEQEKLRSRHAARRCDVYNDLVK